MADYKVIMVNPDQLVDSPSQPDSRTAAIGPMNHLKASIQNTGLQYPPLVIPLPDGQFQIIDGHRRVVAMRELNYPKIPVLPTVGNPAILFAEVSGNVAKMKATEWIIVHLKGGIIPPGPTRSCITKLEEHMGRSFLERLATKGASPAIWNLANRVLNVLGEEESSRAKTLEWLIQVNSRDVSSWIAGQNDVNELRTARDQNRDPSFKSRKKEAA